MAGGFRAPLLTRVFCGLRVEGGGSGALLLLVVRLVSIGYCPHLVTGAY